MHDHGVFVFNDANAHGGGPPQHVYTVHFASKDLWGEQVGGKDSLYLDLFESYMDPAPGAA